MTTNLKKIRAALIGNTLGQYLRYDSNPVGEWYGTDDNRDAYMIEAIDSEGLQNEIKRLGFKNNEITIEIL